MNLHELAQAVSGTVSGKWINVRGPGHSAADRSLGFILDPEAPDGFRLHSLAGDDPAICREYVRAMLRRVREGKTLEVSCELERDRSQAGRVHSALNLWKESQPAIGSIVETYLSKRHCRLLEDHELRFHPSCPFGHHRRPAMIALMRDIHTNALVGIHRTALREDGTGKGLLPDGSTKRMLGIGKNAAVKLGRAGVQLGIAEGIETALSAGTISDMPIWAVLSASGIEAFPMVQTIEHLTIFADHDEAGLTAAHRCASRYSRAGVLAAVHHPEAHGTDWNDYLVRRSSK